MQPLFDKLPRQKVKKLSMSICISKNRKYLKELIRNLMFSMQGNKLCQHYIYFQRNHTHTHIMIY